MSEHETPPRDPAEEPPPPPDHGHEEADQGEATDAETASENAEGHS